MPTARTTRELHGDLPLFALARRTDPATSRDAAARVPAFRGDHERRILEALTAGPAHRDEIAARAGMTRDEVWRRLAGLERRGTIERTGEQRRGVSGCRQAVWRRCE
jgi:predicted Rossmann fold nucleotide-binding protein DprA/Smf involved in DNA uptake